MGERRPGRGDRPPPSSAAVGTLVPKEEPPPKPGGSLIEFSSIVRDDPNEGLVFGDVPEHCSCPHCDRSVVTFIDHEASWVTWLLGLVVWFSLGWMAFWILPLLWPAFKDVVHHCPRCLNVVARKSRISLPTFRTEVMTFKIGGCAVVLARKYVAIMLGLVVTILGVYLLRSTVHLNTIAEVQKGPPSLLTWDDFLLDCGPRTSLRHRASTARSFEERFRRRTFKWQGEVQLIREGFDVFFVKTKSVVMVKMYPQRYPRRDMPDVALLFSEDRNAEVGTLEPGEWVEFEATMAAHGYRGDPEVMMLWHISGAQRPSPLASSPGGSARAREEEHRDTAEDGAWPHEGRQVQAEVAKESDSHSNKAAGSEAHSDAASGAQPRTEAAASEAHSGAANGAQGQPEAAPSVAPPLNATQQGAPGAPP